MRIEKLVCKVVCRDCICIEDYLEFWLLFMEEYSKDKDVYKSLDRVEICLDRDKIDYEGLLMLMRAIYKIIGDKGGVI